MKRAVIALSGGMDSTCLLMNLLRNGYDDILAVTFDYGQSNILEVSKSINTYIALREQGIIIRHEVLDLSSVGRLLESDLTNSGSIKHGHYKDKSMISTVVPNRNVIFSSIIYGIAQSIASKTKEEVDIVLGVQQGEDSLYKDSTPESREACEHAFKISNYDSELVNYKTPYISFSKADILEDLIDSCEALHLSFNEVLMNTVTSYEVDRIGRSSGKSSSDIKRVEAFIQLDLRDPIPYVDGWIDTVAHVEEVLRREKEED